MKLTEWKDYWAEKKTWEMIHWSNFESSPCFADTLILGFNYTNSQFQIPNPINWYSKTYTSLRKVRVTKSCGIGADKLKPLSWLLHKNNTRISNVMMKIECNWVDRYITYMLVIWQRVLLLKEQSQVMFLNTSLVILRFHALSTQDDDFTSTFCTFSFLNIVCSVCTVVKPMSIN